MTAVGDAQLRDRKGTKELIMMLCLNKTTDQLAMANKESWHGHVLWKEDGHVLWKEDGHALWKEDGHALWKEDGHALWKEDGQVL